LKDVAPTVLTLLGVDVPSDMEGKVVRRDSLG
jgi:bisphosphoglycerate-independent phosphoglycerate mutase (AlkP superfamily)